MLLVQECKGLRTSGQLNFIALWILMSKREEGLWLLALPAQRSDTLLIIERRAAQSGAVERLLHTGNQACFTFRELEEHH